MSMHLFSDFLDDPCAYALAERYWCELFFAVAAEAGQQTGWRTPWLATWYLDGTPRRDGNPIFSAVSSSNHKGVCIRQGPPDNINDQGYYAYIQPLEFEGFDRPVDVLYFSCVLTQKTADAARRLIKRWMDPSMTAKRMEVIVNRAIRAQ